MHAGDSLAGAQGEHVGKVKLKAWRGPAYIGNPAAERAGVGWILAENWWPYQRPSFVTPPFAGYVSGHSTFSRAAAEVLTLFTGDPYFPGGLGEFHAPKDDFLVFEAGPSVDVTLQWATYRDASDQTSLSRIWGGIHPPADDIPGRRIGARIGVEAFAHATRYFEGQVEAAAPPTVLRQAVDVFPNPVAAGRVLTVQWDRPAEEVQVRGYNALGQRIYERMVVHRPYALWNTAGLPAGVYLLEIIGDGWRETRRAVVVK